MTTVCIEQGVLKGTLETTVSGKTYLSFKGIPYAEPPIGENRFKEPRPAQKWIGIRDASSHGDISPQWNIFIKKFVKGNEDCLFLNVYTPIVGSNYPVMVWFHGGAFQCGSGNSTLYGPDYLIEEDVVLVTVNYRLSILGFLSLDTKDIPGNAGMKDQVLSLKWVRDNISKFRGNPENVTIFGESSGGVSATYHMISPLSKGLFHRIISQSGTFLNSWSFSNETLEKAFRIGKFLGKNTDDPEDLMIFLRNQSVSELFSIHKDNPFNVLFCPTIEKSFTGQDTFLPKSPMELLKEGNFTRVPIIVGYNNAEGIICLKNVLSKPLDFKTKIPSLIKSKLSENMIEIISNKICQFYFSDEINRETSIINMESDLMFTFGIIKFAKTMASLSDSPVYFYRFSADCELNYTKKLIKQQHVKGACHSDDVFYVFKTWIDPKQNSPEWKAMKRITKLWTNFAKYGNPTPSADLEVIWKPVSTTMTYMEIDLVLKVGTNPDEDRYNFQCKLHECVEEIKKIKSSL